VVASCSTQVISKRFLTVTDILLPLATIFSVQALSSDRETRDNKPELRYEFSKVTFTYFTLLINKHIIKQKIKFLTIPKCKKGKGKGVTRQAEVAQGVPVG
jgi:hypothetical protein